MDLRNEQGTNLSGNQVTKFPFRAQSCLMLPFLIPTNLVSALVSGGQALPPTMSVRQDVWSWLHTLSCSEDRAHAKHFVLFLAELAKLYCYDYVYLNLISASWVELVKLKTLWVSGLYAVLDQTRNEQLNSRGPHTRTEHKTSQTEKEASWWITSTI